MARGLDKHRERQEALHALGRQLARRSGSKCELCGAANVRLAPHEVAPVPDDPDAARTVFACPLCLEGLEGALGADLHHWRCLENSIWSDVPCVQVAAVRLLRRVAEKPDQFWARDCLEQLYLEPEIEEWLDS